MSSTSAAATGCPLTSSPRRGMMEHARFASFLSRFLARCPALGCSRFDRRPFVDTPVTMWPLCPIYSFCPRALLRFRRYTSSYFHPRCAHVVGDRRLWGFMTQLSTPSVPRTENHLDLERCRFSLTRL